MSNIYRALCAELLQAVDTLLGQGESPVNPGVRLILTVHLEDLEDCADRTRAALAQPEPVALTRPECFDFAMDFLGDPEETEVRRYVEALEARTTIQPVADGEVAELVRWLLAHADEHSEESDGLYTRTAKLLQHQHLQPQPVPVGERLPGAEDCDAEGRCWWFVPGDEGRPGAWYLDGRTPAREIRFYGNTHWLPHHALPTP